jgi:hypothetical protein
VPQETIKARILLKDKKNFVTINGRAFIASD